MPMCDWSSDVCSSDLSFPAWPGEQSQVLSPNFTGGLTPFRPQSGLHDRRGRWQRAPGSRRGEPRRPVWGESPATWGEAVLISCKQVTDIFHLFSLSPRLEGPSGDNGSVLGRAWGLPAANLRGRDCRLETFIFTVQLSHPYMTTGKTIALTRRTFVVFSLVRLSLHPSGAQEATAWHRK